MSPRSHHPGRARNDASAAMMIPFGSWAAGSGDLHGPSGCACFRCRQFLKFLKTENFSTGAEASHTHIPLAG